MSGLNAFAEMVTSHGFSLEEAAGSENSGLGVTTSVYSITSGRNKIEALVNVWSNGHSSFEVRRFADGRLEEFFNVGNEDRAETRIKEMLTIINTP